jgi:hypothetical protein
MLKREDIKEGQLVVSQNPGEFGMILNVKSANRGHEKELEYDVIWFEKGLQDGICEYSHMTSNTLSVINKETVLLELSMKINKAEAEYLQCCKYKKIAEFHIEKYKTK